MAQLWGSRALAWLDVLFMDVFPTMVISPASSYFGVFGD